MPKRQSGPSFEDQGGMVQCLSSKLSRKLAGRRKREPKQAGPGLGFCSPTLVVLSKRAGVVTKLGNFWKNAHP